MNNGLKEIDLSLGIPKLISEWKNLFSTKYLSADLMAGTTVACLAIPLSLAIALASGVSPGTGLITAIIAGIICAFFGGTPLAVSGPAAAMSVLIADIAGKFGFEFLVAICLVAGLMQLISGILGIGKLTRYVPMPVIAGFTSGIGVIILISQLPRAFGLQPPPESDVISVFVHLKDYFTEINGLCLLVVILTISIMRGLPKIFPRLPSILAAVIFSTLFVYFFHLKNVPTIGEIPHSLPMPKLPLFSGFSLNELFVNAFAVYLLASLETLLSSSAIDKLTGGKKHEPNQELIGQGLGNIMVSLFGGMPVTSVIARSAVNVRAGAKTRRSGMIQSLIILLAVFAIAPIISMIPIAALAGVLLSVAFSMINYKEFHDLWVTSRSDALVYAVTFLTIIFVDLIAGVQAGIGVAALILLWQASQAYSHASTSAQEGIIRLSLKGPLTFLSIGKVTQFEKELKNLNAGQTVLLDMSNVTNIDITAANEIMNLYQYCQDNSIKFYLRGLSTSFEPVFKICGGEALLNNYNLIYEHELRKVDNNNKLHSARGRLIHGVQQFYLSRKFNNKRLFQYISQRQDPHTLFITCSDSRVVPSLITSSDPGELFIVRNIGNFIPPYAIQQGSSEAAAIEFALNTFDITDIVVCGHANCGAIQACCGSADLSSKPELNHWISLIRSQLNPTSEMSLKTAIHKNVLNQIENLKHYPAVKEKLHNKTLNLHAWFFDFDQFEVFEYNHQAQQFESVVQEVSTA